MSLITCPECKKKVSETARTCPSCGYEFKMGEQNSIKKIETKSKWIGRGLLLLILIATINYCSKTGDNSNENIEKSEQQKSWRDKDNSVGAWTFTQYYVEKQLKSPGSAEFPWGYTQFVQRQGTTYYVNSYVDAQNSYGALLRVNFRAKVEQQGENDWVMLEFEFLE